MKIVFSLIDSFSKFSRLRPYVSKCEVKKNINVTLCGMGNADLTKETIKLLGGSSIK